MRGRTYTITHKGHFGGRGRIRTIVGVAGRFTVCSLWPLGHSPMTLPNQSNTSFANCQHLISLFLSNVLKMPVLKRSLWIYFLIIKFKIIQEKIKEIMTF